MRCQLRPGEKHLRNTNSERGLEQDGRTENWWRMARDRTQSRVFVEEAKSHPAMWSRESDNT